jgi:hypothetical protein
MALYAVIAVVLIIAAAAAVLYWKKKRRNHGADKTIPIPVLYKRATLSYLPKIRPVSPVTRRAIPPAVQKPGELPRQKEVDLVDGRADITESFHALAGKYSLDQFTIATADGLLFASSGEEAASTDAARYGDWHAGSPKAETPGVVLFGFSYKGSDLVGIIRTGLHVPTETLRMIEQDTKDILNRWI